MEVRICTTHDQVTALLGPSASCALTARAVEGQWQHATFLPTLNLLFGKH